MGVLEVSRNTGSFSSEDEMKLQSVTKAVSALITKYSFEVFRAHYGEDNAEAQGMLDLLSEFGARSASDTIKVRAESPACARARARHMRSSHASRPSEPHVDARCMRPASARFVPTRPERALLCEPCRVRHVTVAPPLISLSSRPPPATPRTEGKWGGPCVPAARFVLARTRPDS